MYIIVETLGTRGDGGGGIRLDNMQIHLARIVYYFNLLLV